MKKKLLVLLAVFLVIIIGSTAISNRVKNNQNTTTDDFVVVTSFYPMYVLTANIAKDVPNVSVVNLTENQTGCLHDYQLTTQDMIKLNHADLLVMNGGGMEGFVESILSSYPELKAVTLSEGIDFLLSSGNHDHDHEDDAEDDHDHDHEDDAEDDHDHNHEDDAEDEHDHDHEDDVAEDQDHGDDTETLAEAENHHDHGEYNAHVWMNMDYYLIQMKNVRDALIENDPKNKALYTENYDIYKSKVEKLKSDYAKELTNIVNQDVVIFHDAFAYLAQEIGLDVVYTINMDSDTYLSAGEVKEIIDEVNLHHVKVLFTEEQFSDSIAESISKETDANVYVIDSLVTGDSSLDSYITGMKNNLEVLKQALY